MSSRYRTDWLGPLTVSLEQVRAVAENAIHASKLVSLREDVDCAPTRHIDVPPVRHVPEYTNVSPWEMIKNNRMVLPTIVLSWPMYEVRSRNPGQ